MACSVCVFLAIGDAKRYRWDNDRYKVNAWQVDSRRCSDRKVALGLRRAGLRRSTSPILNRGG
jgi:hypothetical protein